MTTVEPIERYISTAMEQFERYLHHAMNGGAAHFRDQLVSWYRSAQITICQQQDRIEALEMERAELRRLRVERQFMRLDIPYMQASDLTDLPTGQYVYLIRDMDVTGLYKIGRTIKPLERIGRFEVHLPFNVGVVCILPTDNAARLETTLHRRYASKRRNGEWFNLTDDDVLSFLVMANCIHG